MKIDRSLSDDLATLTLKGEFDTFYVPRFLEEIEGLLDQGNTHVLLDMAQVTFANSTAIGAIIKAHKRCRAEEGDVVIVDPSAFVRKVIDALGIAQLVKMFDDEKSAMKHMVAALNKKMFAEAPVDEKVMITFDDDTRNQQVANFTKGVASSSMKSSRRTLIGRMGNVNDERIEFTWSGERFDVTARQAQQLFFVDGLVGLKFTVKLCKKGYFNATAKVTESTARGDHDVKVIATFDDLNAADREALGQYAQDMEFLKRQLPS